MSKDKKEKSIFALRLKEWRKDRGWKMQDAADFLGLARSSYSNYEQDYHSPPLSILSMITATGDVSADYLLGLSDDKNIKRLQTDLAAILAKEIVMYNETQLDADEIDLINSFVKMVVDRRK